MKGGRWECSARASELNLLWALLKILRCVAPCLPRLAGRHQLARKLAWLRVQLWALLKNLRCLAPWLPRLAASEQVARKLAWLRVQL